MYEKSWSKMQRSIGEACKRDAFAAACRGVHRLTWLQRKPQQDVHKLSFGKSGSLETA